MDKINVAIDGPAGAGKSTIAKKVAKSLGFIYVDTGAMYRAMAYACILTNTNIQDEKLVLEVIDKATLSIEYVDKEQQIILNGYNVSDMIRTQEVSNAASIISVYHGVRKKLVSLQQDMAYKNNAVMDGRDIGTCVLPKAQVKIYLTASTKVRAERRYMELIDKGQTAKIDIIESEIEERDYRDMNREISPLMQAEDAIYVDSSDMSIDEVVNTIMDIVNKKIIKVTK